MILTHGANSLPRGGGGMTVTIGGKKYPIVRIGNQLWLAENLDFKFPGLVFGADRPSDSEPCGNYYENDSLSYGKYGLLYNWTAVKYLNDHKADLIPGWHVTSASEWDALATAVGGRSVAGTKLKSTTDWSFGAGTDDYGFSVLPSGYGEGNGNFLHLYSNAYFWTTSERDSSYAFERKFDRNTSMWSDYDRKKYQYSIRLVKDA